MCRGLDQAEMEEQEEVGQFGIDFAGRRDRFG